jgi:hypothetical protein
MEDIMADKQRRPDADKPDKSQVEPYAPPRHPDVNVPDQQFEGEEPKRKSHEREQRDNPKPG